MEENFSTGLTDRNYLTMDKTDVLDLGVDQAIYRCLNIFIYLFIYPFSLRSMVSSLDCINLIIDLLYRSLSLAQFKLLHFTCAVSNTSLGRLK